MSRTSKKAELERLSQMAKLGKPLSPRTIVGITGQELAGVCNALDRYLEQERQPKGVRPNPRRTHPSEAFTGYRSEMAVYIENNLGVRPQAHSGISARFYNVVADLIDRTLPGAD